MMDKKVFLSYSPEDAIYANLLSRTLKKKGVGVFMQDNLLAPGIDWDYILRKELEESSAVVALISDNWAQSNWAAAEYGAAYASGKKFIPVLIEDVTGKIFIDINKYATVDAKNEDIESVALQLQEAI